jgi:SAM-dependent methyltransferase
LFYFKWVLILAFILFGITLYKYTAPPSVKIETFTQLEPFVLKQGTDVYDTFYAELYDALHDTDKRIQSELIEMIHLTNPTTKYTTFLDVGSGTGNIVHELSEAGYDAYGIERSQMMIDYSTAKYPDINIVHGNAMDPMNFETGTFSHILCTYFTIYQFEDKALFFRNCYHWLKPNGFLIVHLVDPTKFTQIIPKSNSMSGAKRLQRGTRMVVKQEEQFEDYLYKMECELPMEGSPIASLKETLVDNETAYIRQNEQTLYMESLSDILDMATSTGFILHGYATMKKCNGDEHQYLYIFERQG